MKRDQKNSLLLKLSKLTCVDEGALPETFRAVTESLAQGLLVARASIWFYGENDETLKCVQLYEAISDIHSSGTVLSKEDYPAYFSFLAEERTLPAYDARNNEATYEFSEPYLKPNNIFSMLDAPIRLNGKTIGVICCENIGSYRNWTGTEELFVGNVSDIISRAIQANQRHLAYQKLEEMNQHLERLVQERTHELEVQRARTVYAAKMASLGEMAGSIAHEINNPVAIILGLVLQLRRRHEENSLPPDIFSQLLTDIEGTSLRIEKIVRGLRFFAREGSFEDKKIVSLFDIVDDTMGICQEKLRVQNCEVYIDVPKDQMIECSPVGISHAILNIIANAADALQNVPIKWIKVISENAPGRVILRISDSGPGIPEGIRQQIMHPFFTTKPVGKGTGLGLPIVKGIIEQHKGSSP